MTRTLYTYAFLEDFVLFYPVYALLFARSGVSPAGISSLFAIWSVAAFALELPTGVWADLFPRRRLLAAAPVLTAAGFALWTFLPDYPAFAAGFALWGVGGALRSGTLQALVYEDLARTSMSASYERILGRSQAVNTLAVVAASAVASPVLAVGGFRAVGLASIAVQLLAAAVGASFPETGTRERRERTSFDVLRSGLADVRHAPELRRGLIVVAVLVGVFGALDEYVPLLAQSTGVSGSTVPLLVLPVVTGVALGSWWAGRGTGGVGPALALAAVLLAAGVIGSRRVGMAPVGMVAVAAAFGIFQWATVGAEARLQERIGDTARATVTSLAGVGEEVVTVLAFGAYGLGSGWMGPGLLFALAAIPYLAVSAALWRPTETG